MRPFWKYSKQFCFGKKIINRKWKKEESFNKEWRKVILSNDLWLNLIKNLALCETDWGNSIDSGNFSVRDFLSLMRKDSDTLFVVLQFMWRKDFLLYGKDFLLNLYFWKALLHSVSYIFFHYEPPHSSFLM